MKSFYWILAAFVCAIGIWFVWSFRLTKEISIPTVAPEIIQNTSPAPVKGAHWKLDELDYVLRWIPSTNTIIMVDRYCSSSTCNCSCIYYCRSYVPNKLRNWSQYERNLRCSPPTRGTSRCRSRWFI